METIKEVFINFKQQLTPLYTPQETEALTLMVLTEITGSSKAVIKAFPEQELTLTQQEEANTILTQLKTGKPLQYILGYTEFYGLKFLVNPAVLIPRPETEELVEWAISSWPLTVGSSQFAVGNILDIGTGSGCIAVSLKKNLANVTVSAMDISQEALITAKENAQLNEVDVNFIEADILNFEIDIPKSKIIISNPPYVTLVDKQQMHTNVTDFEPHTALFVPEDDPLLFYRAIADFALGNLIDNGLLFFEINESLGRETAKILKNKGFKNIELRQDMNGRDRMIRAEK
jgi:release factor glutamine methyltransferase